MPLFKLSAPFVNEIDADISLHCISVSGTMGAHGSLTLPLLTISGKMQDVINGEIRLWGFQVDGEIGVSAKIDADMTLPMLTVAGDMQAEGLVVLHAMRIAGFLQTQGIVNAELSLPALRIAGGVDVLGAVTGEIALPLIQVAGKLTQDSSARITGSATLPALRIDGVLISTGEHSYGSETDATLRYDAARRHI